MNKVLLIGRLTKDCEVKYTSQMGNPFLNFTLAVQKPYNKNKENRDADFIRIIYWKKWCESLAPYLTKGKLISIFGRISVKSFTDKDGEKKFMTEIVAEEIQFIDSSSSKEKSS
ncbi:single-stranded DNA-binding protein [Clostridium rectalis]|uniref:single-stranded DNA-binding protein n=1 Tax=Clostridium rectalis TaxID=2040295 RepID=UPI000F63BF34|nr:single-stranded DNA-binding protein [Clostridium rectalis]